MAKRRISRLGPKGLVAAFLTSLLLIGSPAYSDPFCEQRKYQISWRVSLINYYDNLLKDPRKNKEEIMKAKSKAKFNLDESISLYNENCGTVRTVYNEGNLEVSFD